MFQESFPAPYFFIKTVFFRTSDRFIARNAHIKRPRYLEGSVVGVWKMGNRERENRRSVARRGDEVSSR